MCIRDRACVGVLSACTSVPTQQMEWDNPCTSFHEDIVSGVDPEVLHARYGLNPNASVSGLGNVVGYDCMAGSDSGLEALTVRRRAGQDVYLDYIIAEGGALSIGRIGLQLLD